MFGAIGRGGQIYYTLTEVSQVLYIIDKRKRYWRLKNAS